jgi:sec-independent protein translocase protein TatA
MDCLYHEVTPPQRGALNAMPFNIGPMELVVVLIIALVVLGPKKLPEVGRSLGKGMREFKDSLSNVTTDDERDESKRLNA